MQGSRLYCYTMSGMRLIKCYDRLSKPLEHHHLTGFSELGFTVCVACLCAHPGQPPFHLSSRVLWTPAERRVPVPPLSLSVCVSGTHKRPWCSSTGLCKSAAVNYYPLMTGAYPLWLIIPYIRTWSLSSLSTLVRMIWFWAYIFTCLNSVSESTEGVSPPLACSSGASSLNDKIKVTLICKTNKMHQPS